MNKKPFSTVASLSLLFLGTYPLLIAIDTFSSRYIPVSFFYLVGTFLQCAYRSLS